MLSLCQPKKGGYAEKSNIKAFITRFEDIILDSAKKDITTLTQDLKKDGINPQVLLAQSINKIEASDPKIFTFVSFLT